MMKFRNRVYGVIGIKGIMSNWNADFSGRPKTTSKNKIFGSDKAFKYPIKYQWINEGDKVLYIKSYKEEKDKIQPRTLKERYEYIFNTKLDKKSKTTEVLANLFSAIDVMNFGATFAEGNKNISITGAVQIGQGMNIYDDTRVEIQDILSPFRNPKTKPKPKKDSEDVERSQTSIGTKIFADETHYCYPLVVNPFAYDEYAHMIQDFEGYSKEAYEKLKDGTLRAATAFATNSKLGCENEYAIFVTLKEESRIILPNLANFISFEKSDDKDILDLGRLSDVLNKKVLEEVKEIEIYINSFNLQLNNFELEKAKVMNIFTREVI
jgi:CRISPR-associated protein Csh2